MNKPILSLFVFSVVYCVVFRQKLKKTRPAAKYLFAEVRGLDILYFCCLGCSSSLFLFLFLSVCFWFRLVFLSLFIYNRTKHIYKQTTTEQLKETHQHITNKKNTYLTNKQKSPSRNLRYIYSRSGRGLDILYFCFCFLCCS